MIGLYILIIIVIVLQLVLFAMLGSFWQVYMRNSALSSSLPEEVREIYRKQVKT